MKRGEIWTAAARGDYEGKPRPVVIVQSDQFDATDSITICLFTTDETEAPLIRIQVQPTAMNGLSAQSSIMVDKVTTVRKDKVRERIGRVSDEVMVALNQALTVFLGIAG